MSSPTHRDLAAWQEAMKLVEIVYRDTTSFPKEETYCLTMQIKKSAISIPSNIAEGAARNTSGELLQFLGIACGSLAELETQLELSVRLGYLRDRKSTRLNSSHSQISYAVFCLKKKTKTCKETTSL